MSDKQECLGGVGISDEHTCTGYADFQAMKEARDANWTCEVTINELQAENERLRILADAQRDRANQIDTEYERLRAALRSIMLLCQNDAQYIALRVERSEEIARAALDSSETDLPQEETQ